MKRVKHLHAMVRQRKDDCEIRWNLKTMNEQQRTMLRKSGKQLFVEEVDQLTTKRSWTYRSGWRSETWAKASFVSTCELLGGGSLRSSQYTGCDLLTHEGSSRDSWSAQRQLPVGFLVPSFLYVVVAVAMGETVTSATKQTRSCAEDEDWFEPH